MIGKTQLQGIYLVSGMALVVLTIFGLTHAFGGYSDPTDAEWLNTTWHFRMRVEINTTEINMTDWPVELFMNFTDLIDSGTFDNNSVRVYEYNSTGRMLSEITSQFDKGEFYNSTANAVGDVVFLLNGTTMPHSKRIFYIYYDILENGNKPPPTYSAGTTNAWDALTINITTTKLAIRIDTNRADNTSGIYYAEDIDTYPVLMVDESSRTAEYLEFFNGTDNTTFLLRGNFSVITGPVRTTIRQEGYEVALGNATRYTNKGRVVKKYYIYNRAGPQAHGSFLKISHEFFSNGTVSRSSNAGAVALDLAGSFLSQPIESWDGNATDPYSWGWMTGGGSVVAGIVNMNETSPNYYALNNTPMGRLGIGLSDTSISGSIMETALVYFGTGGGNGVSEFLEIRNMTFFQPVISRNLTEKMTVSVKPEMSRTFLNLNETLVMKGNVSGGDPYNLVVYMNATLDMGTPSSSDDLQFILYDDGTNGDEAAGDRIFSNNYTLKLNSTIGEWKINFTAYGNASQYLNSTMFLFNVTNVYSVSINIFNYIGIVNRQVIANVSVMTYDSTVPIPEALINCSYNGIAVVNKTDNGNGNYSINFTAPSIIGIFTLQCNASKYNNTGSGVKNFTTEPPKTYMGTALTPPNVTINTVTIYDSRTFDFVTNVTNIGNGTSHASNISLALPPGWNANSTYHGCGDIYVNASCLGHFNITVPNATSPGNYTVNISITWTNPDESVDASTYLLNIAIGQNPLINVTQTSVNGTAADGTSKVIGIFTVYSVGNYVANLVTYNCTSGQACTNFTITFSPVNITNILPGNATNISIIASVPLNYTPGIYSGIINVTGAGRSFLIALAVEIQNKTNISVATNPPNIVITGLSMYNGASFDMITNITNIGNSSARNVTANFTIPENWTVNATVETCGNLIRNSVCSKNNSFTISNSTMAGDYTVNITVAWQNVDGTNETIRHVVAVTIAESPVMSFDNFTKNGNVTVGATTNPFNLTVMSVGASNINNIRFNCTSGEVCANFSPKFYPSLITTIIPGNNVSVRINFTVPSNFHAGTYSGLLNVSSSNAENKTVVLYVTVLPNNAWTAAPVTCRRSMYPDEGKVCDINVTNTGNEVINFTVSALVQNYTYTDVTNFSIDQYASYVFSIMYNATNVTQDIFNSSFLIQAVQPSTPQNMTINVTLLPSAPPTMLMFYEPVIDQMSELVILVNITDMTNSGLSGVNITVVRPDSTVDFTNMSLVSSSGNKSTWRAVYAANIVNYTFGNTTLRGNYTITVLSIDNIGNVGNVTGNFTVRKRLNIASNTLGSQYVQGDTGTIYYSVRDVNNTGLQNVNVTFWVYDPNMTLLYTTNRITDSIGTFTPLPVFSLASDAPVGNYILVSNSWYNDTEYNMSFTIQKNYTFVLSAKTVVVTGLSAELETAVVWFPNNIMRFYATIDNGQSLVDPDTMVLSVLDPAQNPYFTINMSSMTKRETGFYSYSHAMPTTSATGMYLAALNITRGSLSTKKIKAFRVAQGGPYDVRLVLAKSEVEQGTPLDFTIVIENKGEVTQDVLVNYSIVNMATGTAYYFSSEAVLTPAFTNQSFTRSAYIYSNQPLGNYVLQAMVRYDNTQPEINTSASFIVISKRFTQPQPSGGGSPGLAPPITAEVVTPEPEVNSIIIEKYSKDIRVYPGFKRIEYVIVRNSGKTSQRGISLNIIGLPVAWYNITPSVIPEMIVGNSSVFLVEYGIPEGANLGDYKFNFIATTSTTSDQKSATLHILGSLSDLILADIAQLKEDLKNLLIDIGSAKSQGKNVDEVLLLADEVQKYINKAEINYNLNNMNDAMQNVKDGRIVLDKARELLNRLEVVVSGETSNIFIIILIAAPIAVLIVLIILRKKNKMPKQLSQQLTMLMAIVEKIRAPRKVDTSSLGKEKEKLSRMLSILDKQKSEKTISDEAYKEMMKSIETKLDKINKKLK